MSCVTLAETLQHHVPTDAREERDLDTIRRFVAEHHDPFDRSIPDAHLTASAFVVSADTRALLLIYHRRLASWLQPGGHGEPGEAEGDAIALREAREETGIEGLALHPDAPRPFDVDVHRIPASGETPAHDHLDLRYVVIAPAGAEPAPCALETRGARWYLWSELEGVPRDQPMHRALAKIRKLIEREAG
jgi:8-oxo-dGTP pyrophosphatase MutT (NUDIX family)